MSTENLGPGFKIAVSDKQDNKLGTGSTSQDATRSLYYYAERTPEGVLFIQPLNGDFHPSGRKRNVTQEAFMESYRPEPLFYYNRVKPAIEAVETNLEKGEKHLQANRADLAEKCFKRALDTDAENIRGIFGLGLAYLAAGKTSDAENVLGDIMGLDLAFSPEHAHLFNQFGIQMRKSGMLRQALDYYNKALALNDADEHLHFNVCRIYFEMDEIGPAIDCVSKALSLNEGFSEGAKMLAHLLKLKPDHVVAPQVEPGESGIERYPGLDLEGLPWEED